MRNNNTDQESSIFTLYNVVKHSVALISTAGANMLYEETTGTGQNIPIPGLSNLGVNVNALTASAMGGNSPPNYWVALLAFDFLAEKFTARTAANKRNIRSILEGIAILFASLLASSPQGIIAYAEAPATYSQAKNIAATSAVLLSNTLLCTFSMHCLLTATNQLVTLASRTASYKIQSWIGKTPDEKQTALYENRKTVLKNLHTIQERLRARNTTSGLPDSESEGFLSSCIKTAQDVKPKPIFCGQAIHPYATNTVKALVAAAAASVLLYGSMGYTCDTERGIRQNIWSNPDAACVLANMSMSLLYILSFKGGIGVASGVVDSAAAITNTGSIPREFKLGSKKLIVAFISTLAAIPLINFYSGYTSGKLLKSCASSKMNNEFLSPQYTGDENGGVVAYSSAAFNSIYCVFAFQYFFQQFIKLFGKSETNRNARDYLLAQEKLDAIIAEVQSASDDNALDTILKTFDDTAALALKNQHLFLPDAIATAANEEDESDDKSRLIVTRGEDDRTPSAPGEREESEDESCCSCF